MNFLRHSIKFIDSLNEKIGFLVSWMTGLIVLVVCYDVFTRYVLQKSSVAVQELEWHLFAVIFLLGAAHTLKHDKHVRIDIFYAKLPKKGKAMINLVGTLLFLIPFVLLILWTSKDFVANSFAIGESSPDPGGLPARYILKACIPISFFLLLLQGISLAFKSVVEIIGNEKETGEKTDG
jgi:TRAP-type mannitol/chloroaromatic compound transport system permease small subunit